jgi:hypothetical protein
MNIHPISILMNLIQGSRCTAINNRQTHGETHALSRAEAKEEQLQKEQGNNQFE